MTETTDENRDPPDFTELQIIEGLQLLLDMGLLHQARLNPETKERPWELRYGSLDAEGVMYEIHFTRDEAVAFLVGTQIALTDVIVNA